MSIANLTTTNPFDDATNDNDTVNSHSSGIQMVHLRIQKRNGRKSVTTISGLPKGLKVEKYVFISHLHFLIKCHFPFPFFRFLFLSVSLCILHLCFLLLTLLFRVLKEFRRMFCCNGIIVEDDDGNKVIQLQGDHREAVQKFLVVCFISFFITLSIIGGRNCHCRPNPSPWFLSPFFFGCYFLFFIY